MLCRSFESVDHTLLISALKRYGFDLDFTQRIKVALKKNRYAIINNAFTTGYFGNQHGIR